MSLPTYPEYKESGVDWLGRVPAHWSSPRLKTLLQETDERAGASDAELLGLSKSLGVVRRSVLDQGVAESDDYGKYKLVHPGQLVMNKMQAWNGVFGLSANFGMVSPDYATFRFLQPELGHYLSTLFRTGVMAGVFFTRCRGMGTAFLRINSGDFLDIKVPLPPLEDVRTIAAFLDRETGKIDALIAEQEKLIALLAEKRQATISQIVTRGLDPDAPMKDSGSVWLGQIPAHWDVVPLMHLTPRSRPIMYGIVLPGPDVEDGIPIVKGGDVKEHRLKLELLNRTTADIEAPYARARLRPLDIVYSIRGTIGDAEVVPDVLLDANITQDVARISPSHGIQTRWLLHVMKSKPVFVQLEQRSLGAAVRGINIFELKRARVPVPPAHERNAIAAFLDAETAKLDALAAEAERAIGLLTERRSALIAAAVTGQIDVRGAVSQFADQEEIAA